MKQHQQWDLGPGIKVVGAKLLTDRWVVAAEVTGSPPCPDCGVGPGGRHGAYVRHLQDLPVQGKPVELRLRISRWCCRNVSCSRRTFSGHNAPLVAAYARQTGRVTETVRLVAHAAGGRPAERLLRCLGLPQGDDRILRHLKRHAAAVPHGPIRVAGIDEWSWKRGTRYGTLVVDLERRAVVDVLPDRSQATTAAWLRDHPSIEVVSRDRCGLYAQAARQGAPQARQIADRFHLMQNLRFAIERQLSRTPRVSQPDSAPRLGAQHAPSPHLEHQDPDQEGRRLVWLTRFAEVKELQQEGKRLAAIVTLTRLNWRTVAKWIACDTLPERRRMDPRPRNPVRFTAHLARRWVEGCRNGRQLLFEVCGQGYSGSRAQLERLLWAWRRDDTLPTAHLQAEKAKQGPVPVGSVPPIAASIMCMTPRSKLTSRQASRVDVLKEHVPGFAEMRQLAMRFRGILRSKDPTKLDVWLADVRHSGLHAIRRFAQILRRDIDAVKNAVREDWSNGQTEGQINKLKALKRSMYGHAGAELLRARMLPVAA